MQFYLRLNDALRAGSSDLADFLPILRLLVLALSHLPKKPIEALYRAVSADVYHTVAANKLVTEYHLISCSEHYDSFAGRGYKTRCKIHPKTAVPVMSFSAFPQEKEWLLLPGTQFRILSVHHGHDGITHVEMEEVGNVLL